MWQFKWKHLLKSRSWTFMHVLHAVQISGKVRFKPVSTVRNSLNFHSIFVIISPYELEEQAWDSQFLGGKNVQFWRKSFRSLERMPFICSAHSLNCMQRTSSICSTTEFFVVCIECLNLWIIFSGSYRFCDPIQESCALFAKSRKIFCRYIETWPREWLVHKFEHVICMNLIRSGKFSYTFKMFNLSLMLSWKYAIELNILWINYTQVSDRPY